MTGPAAPKWPHGSQDAIGQVAEFLVWAAIGAQSWGRLHVFLPLLDRGIDGIVHRLDDGAYIAVQIKAKSLLHGPEAAIAVFENHLFTPDQLVIGVHLEGDRLGAYALVIDAATFKRKATRVEDRGRVMLVADMPVEPIAGHKWSEDLVPISLLADRLGAGARPSRLEALPSTPIPDEDRVIGFWGEQEVCRRLAMLEDCGLFRPFPDNEIVEIAIRRLETGRTLGVQVKTVQLEDRRGYGHVLVNRASFVAAPSTMVVALAWVKSELRFHEACLLVPSTDLPGLAGPGGAYFELHFRPEGSREESRLDRYRLPLDRLASRISGLLE